MRQMASPMLSVPLVLDDCCTWRSHSCPTMTTRTHEQERQGGIRRPRAQVQQSSREPPTAVSRVPPPPHVRILAKFIRLLPLASYCVDATERRASAAPKATEIHKTRNPRPFTGFFFGPYMHPNRPLDLKIVFNQHPKPLNGHRVCPHAPASASRTFWSSRAGGWWAPRVRAVARTSFEKEQRKKES